MNQPTSILPHQTRVPTPYGHPRLPSFTIELGMTSRGTLLLLDLLSNRWQAVLQQGDLASTSLLWQQILSSLGSRHTASEIQVFMFTPRPADFALLLSQWKDSWLLTSHPHQLLDELVSTFTQLPSAKELPITVTIIDDLHTFLTDLGKSERWLQVIFLEGSRRGLRLLASTNQSGALQRHPLMQCFTHRIRYLGEGWYRQERRFDEIDFHLTLTSIQIPRGTP